MFNCVLSNSCTNPLESWVWSVCHLFASYPGSHRQPGYEATHLYISTPRLSLSVASCSFNVAMTTWAYFTLPYNTVPSIQQYCTLPYTSHTSFVTIYTVPCSHSIQLVHYVKYWVAKQPVHYYVHLTLHTYQFQYLGCLEKWSAEFSNQKTTNVEITKSKAQVSILSGDKKPTLTTLKALGALITNFLQVFTI